MFTATLVAPRATPPSSNLTLMRFSAGEKATSEFFCMKTLKVGVSFALTNRLTLGVGAARHSAVTGFVWHIDKESIGSPSATGVTTMGALTPTFTEATEKAAAWLGLVSTTPLALIVDASAMMSAVPAIVADIKTVFTPMMFADGSTLSQMKSTMSSAGANSAFALSSSNQDWLPLAATSTGVFGDPFGVFVAGSVV